MESFSEEIQGLVILNLSCDPRLTPNQRLTDCWFNSAWRMRAPEFTDRLNHVELNHVELVDLNTSYIQA
jgi:hypothetical protein